MFRQWVSSKPCLHRLCSPSYSDRCVRVLLPLSEAATLRIPPQRFEWRSRTHAKLQDHIRSRWPSARMDTFPRSQFAKKRVFVLCRLRFVPQRHWPQLQNWLFPPFLAKQLLSKHAKVPCFSVVQFFSKKNPQLQNWLLCVFFVKTIIVPKSKVPCFSVVEFCSKNNFSNFKTDSFEPFWKTTQVLDFFSKFFSATSKLALLIFTTFISAKMSLKIVVFSETSKFQLGI